jgi:hypothetical protein
MDSTNDGADNRRSRRMFFRANSEEIRRIESRASEAGLTVSAYLRAAAMQQRIRAAADLDAVADLVRVNGDLGRVAGLLKLWLAEKPDVGATRFEVERIMGDFRALQRELTAIMGRVLAR